MATLSLRQLRPYRIARRRASFVASVGLMYTGLSHFLDAVGVLAATAGLAFACGRDRSLATTLAPVVNGDPLVALELGLTPPVHDYVAALEQKDLATRDHVIRVGELAMRVGLRAGLSPERLRTRGLAALLHDVGKLDSPGELPLKPDRLSAAEFAVVKRHSGKGAELLPGFPILAAAAHLVR